MSQVEVKGSTLATVYFTLQGVGTLISLNAFLNGLDYFNEKFPDADVFTKLPIAFNGAQLFTNLFLAKIISKFPLRTRVLIPLIVTSCLLVTLPITANILSGTAFGFWIVMAMLFIMGNFNCVYQGSLSGFASSFPFKYTSFFLMGTGIAGIVMNILRSLAIVSFAKLEGGALIGILVYFTAAGLILVSCLLIHPVFARSEFCRAYVKTAEEEPLMSNPSFEDQTIDLVTRENKESQKLDVNFKTILEVFGEVKFFVVCLFVNYIISFFSFPGIMQRKPMPYFTDDWKLVYVLAVFNVFDVIGKNLAQHRSKYTKGIIFGVMISRVIYDVFFVAQAIPTEVGVFNSAWFGFVNIALFGLTNGFVTTALFIMGPEVVDGPKKEVAGFLSIFGLVAGVTLGGLVAIPANNWIVSKNKITT